MRQSAKHLLRAVDLFFIIIIDIIIHECNVDMFPRTSHVETVVLMSRVKE